MTSSSPRVSATYYDLDGTGWNEYSSPFAIADEGIHTLGFYSTDEAGNQEQPPKEAEIKIDKTTPLVTITSPVAYGIYSAASGTTYSFGATDNIDASPEVFAHVTDSDGNTIATPLAGDSLPVTSGVYTLTVTATDDAGL